MVVEILFCRFVERNVGAVYLEKILAPSACFVLGVNVAGLAIRPDLLL